MPSSAMFFFKCLSLIESGGRGECHTQSPGTVQTHMLLLTLQRADEHCPTFYYKSVEIFCGFRQSILKSRIAKGKIRDGKVIFIKMLFSHL